MAQVWRTNDVLVVIDMQHAFADADSPWRAPRFDEALINVERLRHSFLGQVVLTRFVWDPAEPGAWHDYYDQWPAMRRAADEAAWQLIPAVGESDIVMSAPTFSKWGADMAAAVPQDARMILCGVATDCCVIATAMAAVDAGRQVILVADACAGGTDDQHDQAVAVMALLDPLLQVTSVDELLGTGPRPLAAD